ncbi:putative calcium-binding protein CML21 [Hibiscus syriacus]|uniref:Calcium-binding protein CML21 n=1 Tax=Hibiscus syriacus TaxID=106335 RepID=A0A6A2ZGL7_HIBSY|nr:putative calcium-binding protein CML21 [Hibiscus syriacus]
MYPNMGGGRVVDLKILGGDRDEGRDEDSNGAIDHQELKKCCQRLQVSFTEEEITDLFNACDINKDMGINFNEFIVLLCLVYLLKDNANEHESKSRMGMPDLEATFETFVEAFVFLDKNKDGFVSRNEMAQAVNESGERSAGKLAMKRFEEMDWDKNGSVCFKEFLFAFTNWVGIVDTDDEED